MVTALIFTTFGALLGSVVRAGCNTAPADQGELMLSKLFSSRRRKVASSTVMFVAVAATAFAAWQYFSGASGTGGSQADTASRVDSLTLTPNFKATDAKVAPGQTGDVYVDVQNASGRATKLLTLSSSAITSDKPSCPVSGVTFTPNSSVVGASGQSFRGDAGPTYKEVHVKVGSLTAPADWDPACSGASLSVALTGTTN